MIMAVEYFLWEFELHDYGSKDDATSKALKCKSHRIVGCIGEQIIPQDICIVNTVMLNNVHFTSLTRKAVSIIHISLT